MPRATPIAPEIVAQGGDLTPLAPTRGLFERTRGAVRGFVTGWMGPGTPLPALAPPGTSPRQMDYPYAVNTRTTPRSGDDSGISFGDLRALSRNCDLVRLAIETCKDDFARVKWEIAPRDGGSDEGVDEITAFLQRPDRRNPWSTWVRMALEDMLVIDAPAWFVRKTVGGKLFALEPVDGATIHPLIDDTGRTPLEGVAYQQIIKGMPAVEFTRAELIYAPRNPSTDRIYGYSPTEQICLTINIAIRRAMAQLGYFTDGNIPDAFVKVPDTWTAQQIVEFSARWSAMFENNPNERRRVKFVPQGDIHETRAAPIKDEFDEWIARLACFAFSLPPTAFVKQMNRAVAEQVANSALEQGTMARLAWLKDVMDHDVLAVAFGRPDLEWHAQELKPPDPTEQASVLEILVRNGIKSIDEARDDLGLPPIGMGPAVFTATGPVLITDVLNPPEPDPALVDAAVQAQLTDQRTPAQQAADTPPADAAAKLAKRLLGPVPIRTTVAQLSAQKKSLARGPAYTRRPPSALNGHSPATSAPSSSGPGPSSSTS